MKRILSIGVFITLLTINTIAQSGQANVNGTISDSVGHLISGASVVITNESTGSIRNVISKEDGKFSFLSLNPNSYKIKVSANGFSSVTKVVTLLVGQATILDLTLNTNSIEAEVNVVSNEESLINTSSASMTTNVSQREVEGLPNNGRQLSQLYLQSSGAINSGTGTFSDIRFSGRANNQNVIRYDGIEGTAVIDSSPGNLNGEVPSAFRLQSSLENVQEFVVYSSGTTAEFGTGTGGQISVVTKSGGNKFHVSFFEYFRNDRLDARNFFDGGTKSKLQLNQFGGSIGGAIIKNKLFFFSSYEKYIGKFGLNFVEAAPSLSLAESNSVIPNTTTAVSSTIKPYIKTFRSPNATLISASPTFDILNLQSTQKTDEISYSTRLDYQINPYNRAYVRYFRDDGTDVSPEGISGRVVNISASPQNAVFSLQTIFDNTGSKINDFKIGYNGARTRINATAPIFSGLDLSNIALNISGSVANTGIAGQGTSSGVSIVGGLVRSNSATNGRGQPYTPYSLSFIDGFLFSKEKHLIKVGAEIRLIRLYTDRLGGTTYTFSNLNSFLSNTPTSIQYLGDVSSPSVFTDGKGGSRLAKQEYYIGYAQDEWKIKNNVTINYGLRYEYYTPLREDSNQQVLFDIEKGILKPSSESAYKSSKLNFAPRLSITWAINPKTVLRGGFGILYGAGQTEDQIQPIESDRISSTITSGSLLTFPANTQAIVSNFTSNVNNRNYQPRAYSNSYQIPEKIYQYTVSLQKQLPYDTTLTVAYVGSKGTNLFLRSVANKILSNETTIVDGTNIPKGFGVVNRVNNLGQVVGVNVIREFSILNGNTVLNPYAEIDYKTSGGDDKYNSLQVSIQRSFASGITANFQYTLGKSEGTTAGSNEARTSAQLDNFEADRGRNNFDIRHSFNFSGVYTVPKINVDFGIILNAHSGVPIETLIVRPDVVIQCRQIGGCPNGLGGTFVNGYTANLPSFGTSFPNLPLGFVAVVNTQGGGNSRNVRRPDVVTGVSPYLNNDRNYLNPAAFSVPEVNTWGSLSRNALSGPNFYQADVTLGKKFKLGEIGNLEFRAEVFNVFNKANFSNPSATLSNPLPSLSYNPLTKVYSTTNGLQPKQAFTKDTAGNTFGLLRSTVGRTVGLGTNRQIQLVIRYRF